jgi:iron-sulfur cluster repair protein YtfE (RIC family)
LAVSPVPKPQNVPRNAIENFEEFKAGLEQHIIWEEEILFPCFEKKFGLRGAPTEVMRSEHRDIRKFLDAIAQKLTREDYYMESEELQLESVLCIEEILTHGFQFSKGCTVF